MTLYIPGANRTAQWYGDTYSGVYMPTIEKYLLHSTETNDWPGYGGGASMPTCTYHPRKREIRQHQDAERSARALQDPSSTPVRENRDGVFQVEIVAYSDYALARERGGLWIGDLTATHMGDLARMHRWLHDVKGCPLRTDVKWAPGVKTSAGVSGLRLSSSEFDAARGILAHYHASGNVHWDVGGFYINRYLAALLGENDMPLTDAEIAKVAAAVWAVKHDDPRDPPGSPIVTMKILLDRIRKDTSAAAAHAAEEPAPPTP